MLAASSGHMEPLDLLLVHKANPNITEKVCLSFSASCAFVI